MIRRRGSRFHVRVYVGGGKTRHIGTYATRREARAAEIDALRSATAGGNETAGEFALRWVEEYPRPKASTRKWLGQMASQFARDSEAIRDGNRLVVVPKLRLNQITRPIARAYVLSRPRHMRQVLSAMYGDAVRDGLVETNPFADLRLPQSRGRKDIKALRENEVRALASEAHAAHGEYGPMMEAMILFLAYTGVRPGEAFALEWRDISVARAEAHISKRVYAGEVDTPKTGRSRYIVIPPPALEALTGMPRHLSERVFLTKQGTGFTNANRFRVYFASVWQRFEAKLEERDPARAAELRQARDKDHMDPYELRHFCATLLLELGMNERDVAEQLGHSNTKQVLERYGHPSAQAARERLHRAFDRNVVPLSSVPTGEQGAANEA